MSAQRDGILRVRTYWRLSVAINLLYVAYPVYTLVSEPYSPFERVVAAAALGVFALLYVPAVVTAWFRPDEVPDPVGRIVSCTVLAVTLTFALGPAWGGLVIYAAHLAGATVRRTRPAAVAVAVIAALSGVTQWLASGEPLGLTWTGFALLVGLYAVAFGRVVATYRELDGARSELARLAVADERLRFARDLHDLLGHSLSVIALKGELAGRLIDIDPDRARSEVRDIEVVSREALAEVREAVSGYRDSADLAAELRRARSALGAAGVEVAVDGPVGRLPAAAEALLAWTVREGATNIVRHAGARRASIRVHHADGAAGVELVDDGVGAPGGDSGTSNDSGGGSGSGNGLDGLAERVAAADGAFEAGAAPGGGFRLAVRVPG